MEPRTIALGVYDGLADWEVGHATAHLNQPAWQDEPGRFRVRAVGATTEAVSTMAGLRVVPELTLDQLQAEEVALLVLPGADGWLGGANAAFAERAGELLAAGVPVAAICGATVGLAAAGLLDDHDHTSNAPEVLQMAPAYQGASRYRDQLAVTDGDLITASGIAPVAFAREIFARLELYRPAVLASWYKLYADHDPAGYHELMAAASTPA